MMKAIFHIHTMHSADGWLSLQILHERSRARGAQCLIITDHNTLDGAIQFQKRFPDICVVAGEEIYTKEGEIMGLFLRETIPPHLGVEETIRAIRAQGGLVAAPHPFDRRRPSTLKAGALERIEKEIDIVEVFNSRTMGGAPDAQAAAWAQARHKAVIWGADGHYPDDIGPAIFELPAFGPPQEFMSALKEARPVKLQRAGFGFRAAIRVKKRWGVYGPLNGLESIAMRFQRRLFLSLGGGFVSLEQVEEYARQLAARVRETGFVPDRVVGLAGGGVYPAWKMAEALGVPVDFMRVTHPQIRLGHLDTDDMIGLMFLRNFLMGRKPILKKDLSTDVRGQRILLVDDDCTSGDSLAVALEQIRPRAAEVKTAVLRLLGEASPRPDFFMENRVGAVLKHPRFPWIRYSPHYPRYWRLINGWSGMAFV